MDEWHTPSSETHLGTGIVKVGELRVGLGLAVERDDGLHYLWKFAQSHTKIMCVGGSGLIPEGSNQGALGWWYSNMSDQSSDRVVD